MKRLSLFFVLLFSCEEVQVTTTPAADKPVSKETREAAIGVLGSKPNWLPAFDVDICPHEVMPKELTLKPFKPKSCEGDLLWGCVEKCRLGEGVYCLWASFDLQVAGKPDPITEALFLRACMLGEAAGCTNRTAGRLVQRDNAVDACTTQSFRRPCAAGDAWACAMLAAALKQVNQLSEMQTAIDRACTLAPDQEPCKAAQRVPSITPPEAPPAP